MSIFKNRTVIGVICILLALVICFGITPLFNRGISQKAEIVRVTKDIHAGELITKDMVTTAEVGSYNLPSGLMTVKDNVVGKYAKADLAVGDYILAAKISEAPADENAYLYNLDGTKQAISVTIKSFATGLSGKLQSGDIVSVIVADYPETRRQMDGWLEESNSKNRNEFVEKALRFYMGYLGTENITEYLSDALVATLRGIVADSANRTNSLLFKYAVEQGIMAHTIAAHFRDTMEDRRALRGYVVDEVKRTNGQIKFEDAQDVQRQLPDDTWLE